MYDFNRDLSEQRRRRELNAEAERRGLNNLEVFKSDYQLCDACGALSLNCDLEEDCCAEPDQTRAIGVFYWFCFPGCIPEGEPMGPFATHADAFEDAVNAYGNFDCTDAG
jgi:hypothetical protein